MKNYLSTGDFVPAFGLHRVLYVCASEGKFKLNVFDVLEGIRDSCKLGGQFCWHPVLPDSASPTRRESCPDPPVVCLRFGLDRIIFKLTSTFFARRQVMDYPNFPEHPANILNDRQERHNKYICLLWTAVLFPPNDRCSCYLASNPCCLCKPFSCKASSGNTCRSRTVER